MTSSGCVVRVTLAGSRAGLSTAKEEGVVYTGTGVSGRGDV